MGEACAITPPNTPPGLIPWKPGQSGNPSGRPKGSTGLAGYIREHTLDGRELADFLLSVMRGDANPFCKMQDRLKACEMLMDRAFGKLQGPTQEQIEKLKPVLDISALTTEEIAIFERFGLVLASIRNRVGSGETSTQS